MKLLLDAGTAAVHVVEVPVARGEAEPLRHLVVAEHVETQPVAILQIAGRLADREDEPTSPPDILAPVDQLTRALDTQPWTPQGPQAYQPARAKAAQGLLRPPAGA